VCLVHSEGESAHGGKGGEGWGRERVWEVAIEKSKSLVPKYFDIHADIFGGAAGRILQRYIPCMGTLGRREKK